MKTGGDILKGARNLLSNCAGLKAGDRLAILYESSSLGWYDPQAPLAVAEEARKLGLTTSILEFDRPPEDDDTMVPSILDHTDACVFFARFGDRYRFARRDGNHKVVMCYTLDTDMLASDYGGTPYQAMVDLKNAMDDVLLSARRIDLTCPLGTSLHGELPAGERPPKVDVTIRRFPLGVTQPIDASVYSGDVAIARYLTPTGSLTYNPDVMNVDGIAFAEVDRGVIKRFRGDDPVVDRIARHYLAVAEQFDLDANIVHSWHAGIHPACSYAWQACDNPNRWSNTVFNNPRFLHFHTCGAYAPGEICWMVLDPTIAVDGIPLWDTGRLCVEAFDETRRCLDHWPELVELFDHPETSVGLNE